jgi:hypothetical protein
MVQALWREVHGVASGQRALETGLTILFGHLDRITQELKESVTHRCPRRDTDGTHLRVMPGSESEIVS